MKRLVLLVALLAGCSDPGASPEPEVGTVTDPRDYAYNATGQHVHDYWGGEQEKLVLEQSASRTFNNDGGPQSTWTVAFFPPDGSVVLQGTSELAITVSWQESLAANSYGSISLWAKPANATQPRLIAQDLQNGGTTVMALTYNESDLPHQLISAWEFQVRIHGSSEPYNAFFGTITMHVVAQRGLPLVPFPAHPDHWGNLTSIELAQAQGTFWQITYTGTGQFDPRIRPLDGALVPAGAALVSIVLEATNDYPVGDIDLAFHGADSRQWTTLEPASQTASTRNFEILVQPGMQDGPYAEASLWEFLLQTSREPAQGAYDGTYALTATVHKA